MRKQHFPSRFETLTVLFLRLFSNAINSTTRNFLDDWRGKPVKYTGVLRSVYKTQTSFRYATFTREILNEPIYDGFFGGFKQHSRRENKGNV